MIVLAYDHGAREKFVNIAYIHFYKQPKQQPDNPAERKRENDLL
jgi:hypothetical protein